MILQPIAPTQEKTAPSFKTLKAKLKPRSTSELRSCSLAQKKKLTLDPLSTCPALKLDPLLSSGMSIKIGSSKNKIFGCSAFCPASPAQEKEVSAFPKKNNNLEPISASSSHFPILQKTPSLPSLHSIPKLPTNSCPTQRPQTVPDSITRKQKALGPQSLRGGIANSDPFAVLNGNPHAKSCFQDLLMTEEKMCAEWAIYYHSYSTSALIYEVQSAIAAVLFGFRSQNGTLPRLLVKDFLQVPDANALLNMLSEDRRKELKMGVEEFHDGMEEYMAVGLSAMCSLLAQGPEASPTLDFCKGYASSSNDASWDPDLLGAFNKLLRTCGVPSSKIQRLSEDIIALSEKHGLDVSSFNGKRCASEQPGHLLQICIRRDMVDKLVYASHPFGQPDETRQPMSRYMDSNSSFGYGQARVLARPEFFIEPDAVRLHTVSADPNFHLNRETFQKELTELLSLILGDASSQEDAAKSIYAGVLPDGWNSAKYHNSRFSRPEFGARHLVKVRHLPGTL